MVGIWEPNKGYTWNEVSQLSQCLEALSHGEKMLELPTMSKNDLVTILREYLMTNTELLGLRIIQSMFYIPLSHLLSV